MNPANSFCRFMVATPDLAQWSATEGLARQSLVLVSWLSAPSIQQRPAQSLPTAALIDNKLKK